MRILAILLQLYYYIYAMYLVLPDTQGEFYGF